MKKHYVTLAIALMLILSSCDQFTSNPSDEDNANNGKGKLEQLLSSVTHPDGLQYSFYIYKSKSEFLLDDNGTLQTAVGDKNNYYYAYFPDNAGTVKIDDNVLSNNGGSYWKFDSPVALDGDSVLVEVQGSQNVAGFSFYLDMPLNFAKILSPANGSIHDDDSDLTITWDKEASDNMTVVIEISKDNPTDSTQKSYDYVITDDDGEYTFSSSFLQSLEKSIITINLKRGHYLFGKNSENKDYGAFAYSQHQIMIKLTD